MIVNETTLAVVGLIGMIVFCALLVWLDSE